MTSSLRPVQRGVGQRVIPHKRVDYGVDTVVGNVVNAPVDMAIDGIATDRDADDPEKHEVHDHRETDPAFVFRPVLISCGHGCNMDIMARL